MKALLLLSLLALVPACQGGPPQQAVDAATLYFPPRLKSVDKPIFSFSPAEREKAIRSYKAHGANTLFELVIDHEGQVRKARVVRSHIGKAFHEDLEAHALRLVFSGDPDEGRYRTFFFPTNYTRHATFEWL